MVPLGAWARCGAQTKDAYLQGFWHCVEWLQLGRATAIEAEQGLTPVEDAQTDFRKNSALRAYKVVILSVKTVVYSVK